MNTFIGHDIHCWDNSVAEHVLAVRPEKYLTASVMR